MDRSSKIEADSDKLALQLQKELSETIKVGKDVREKVDSIRESAESLEKFDEDFVEQAEEALRFINRHETGEEGHFDLTPEQRTALVDNIMEMDEKGKSQGIDHTLLSEFGAVRKGTYGIQETAGSLSEDLEELNELQDALKATLYQFRPNA